MVVGTEKQSNDMVAAYVIAWFFSRQKRSSGQRRVVGDVDDDLIHNAQRSTGTHTACQTRELLRAHGARRKQMDSVTVVELRRY